MILFVSAILLARSISISASFLAISTEICFASSFFWLATASRMLASMLGSVFKARLSLNQIDLTQRPFNPLFGDTMDGFVVFRAQARKACEPKNSGDVFDFVGFGTVNASDDVGHDGFGNKEALHLVALDGLQEFKRLLIFDALRAN